MGGGDFGAVALDGAGDGAAQGLPPAQVAGLGRPRAEWVGWVGAVVKGRGWEAGWGGVGVDTRVQAAIPMDAVCEPYIRRRAVRHLEKGRVVIFAAGTGNPYFTTDTAATLRAMEMDCDALFKGTQVDGVYDSDPKTNPDAVRYSQVSYDEVLTKHLKVMDASAIALARDNNLPIVVFSLKQDGAMTRVLFGEGRYTVVGPARVEPAA